MRSVLLRSLAVLAVGGAVLAAILYVASTVDSRPPLVTGVQLTQHLATDESVALTTTSVEIHFSETVDHASAEAAVTAEPAIEGSFSWSGTTLTFTPRDPLPLESAFTITVAAGPRDAAGNEMRDPAEPLRFSTVGSPRVASTVPADGDAAVPRDAPIEVVFSTLMDTTSVERALTLTPVAPITLRWSGERLTVIPEAPLEAGRRYTLTIDDAATDLAGTPLDERLRMAFVTSSTGLEVVTLLPADGVEGIAATTAIGIVLDRPVDPESVDGELLTITPEVSGSLEAVPLPGAAGLDDGGARLLRFLPSSPLPPNTTFDVSLAPGLLAADGGELSEATAWSFTTGAPSVTLSNQVVFLSARGGVANVWAMNPDGTNQRQVTAELSPVIDYAVAPDGRSLVVGDGAELVEQLVDGRDRRLLTDPLHLEFDPAYSPDGRTIAFGRADRATGGSMGIWGRGIGGGDAAVIPTDEEPAGQTDSASPSPSAGGGARPAPLLREPTFAPDGEALAVVDTAGRLVIVELEEGRVTAAPIAAAGPPVWLPDSDALLVSGVELDAPMPDDEAPRHPGGRAVDRHDPTSAADDQQVLRLVRGSREPQATPFDAPARLAVDASGRIAAVLLDGDDPAGPIWITTGPGAARTELLADGELVATWVGFTPETGTLVASRATPDGVERGVVLVDAADGSTTRLTADGSRPRWLP